MVDDTDPASGMTADQRRQVAAYGPSGLGTFWKDLQTNRAPLIAAVQDQRLGSYLVDEGGKLWDAAPKPWKHPNTTQAVLDTTALPAKAVVGMGKGLGSIIKEAVTNPTPKTSAEAALSVAGLGGGLAALGVGAKQARSLGMFIGPHGAKNLGKDVSENLEKAKIMEKKADSNADPFWPTVAASKNKALNENLRTNYGWHKNPGDNLWRLEIPTAENLKFKSEKYGVGLEDSSDGRYRYSNPTTKSPLRWDDILSFPDLEKAYPALKDIHLDVTIERGRKVPTGSHRPAFQKAPARIKVSAAPEDIKSVILHELQHFIQYQEGFAKGSSPRKMRELFKDGNKMKASGTPLPYELQEVQKWFKDAKVELRQLAKEHLATAQHMEERLPIVKDPKRTLEDREKIQTLREDAEKIENILTRAGATSSSFKDAYKQEMNTLATWVYAKHAGEVEAGIVQARMDLTPQQRLETPPTESLHLGQKIIPYTGQAKRFLERLEIPEQIVVDVGKFRRAHGGPVYASELLHMAEGGLPKPPVAISQEANDLITDAGINNEYNEVVSWFANEWRDGAIGSYYTEQELDNGAHYDAAITLLNEDPTFAIAEYKNAEAPGSRPKDPSNLPALIAKTAALSLPDEPRPKGKGQRFRGIGSLMRRRLFPLIQAAQLGYGHLLSPEQKAEIKDFLASPAHEMVGMDKPGIEYFKDLLGVSETEPQGEGVASLAEEARNMTSGPRSLALR